jgi:pimeloyl-ACP methyl ester carboxylesterase
VFSPSRQPSPTELDQLWGLVAGGGGRRVLPRILNYMEERRICRVRWVGALAASPVPLLLVNGDTDPVSGRRSADRWAELLPRHELVRLPDTGHWPQLESPEAVIVQALAFFTG